MASSPALSLPQQFARFLLVGSLVFLVTFWMLSSAIMTTDEIRRNQLALRMIVKTFTSLPTGRSVQDLQTGYIPFFLEQRSLVVAYSIAVQAAWFVAFLFDTKILRREKKIQ